MDFERVLAAVSGFFDRTEYPYAVIGGLSMAAYGMARSTLAIDLVTSSSAQADFIAFLEGEGYETYPARYHVSQTSELRASAPLHVRSARSNSDHLEIRTM